MRLISTAPLATSVSLSGGLGFLGAGSDASTLSSLLSESSSILRSQAFSTGYTWDPAQDPMPVGVGFLIWGISDETLQTQIIPLLRQYKPVAIWLFTPRATLSGTIAEREEWVTQLHFWCATLAKTIPATKIWLQIGSVIEARTALSDPVIGSAISVFVVQGSDAGGHGLVRSAGLISLVPEVCDAVAEVCAAQKRAVPHIIATGGISTGKQVASTLLLGAQGVCLGTRFLACPEANVAKGYRNEVVRASDGGQSTVRSGVYDYLRGTRAWPPGIGGRGVVNKTYEEWMTRKLGPGAGTGVHGLHTSGPVDADVQEARDELERLYKEAEGKAYDTEEGTWGPTGRMTTYAGSGVGLVKKVMLAGEIVKEIQDECAQALGRVGHLGGKL